MWISATKTTGFVMEVLLVSVLLVAVFQGILSSDSEEIGVKYDGTSLIINGQRRIILSGSIHYPRSTPEMWDGLIDKAKDGGLDCIDTYVFWNVHEPQQGQYIFSGQFDLVRFVKVIQSKGLFVTLRIGPYIESEWNFGGFPYWLREIPGIVFRDDNEPFKKEMERFVSMIVEMMKQEKLFASQGGPIILCQIENEYANVEGSFPGGASYVKWAAAMAVAQNTGVPWIMCKQPDAPDPIINTCNGMYCGDTFTGPNSDNKPRMWTEAWTAWFQVFGGSKPHRPVEDIAYAVARFFAKKGTYVNYYMYHGGTNFGRSGGPFITTSYDYDAPIDEYGYIHEPKWGHLKDLNMALKLCSDFMLYGSFETFSVGPAQEAHVYTREGKCAAFLSNKDAHSDTIVTFRNNNYNLPAWSVSILPDCKSEVFNTAKVNIQARPVSLLGPKLESRPTNTFITYAINGNWEGFQESFGTIGSVNFARQGLLEHISTTKDTTDYLWYTISVMVNDDKNFSNKSPILAISTHGHAIHVFLNDVFIGSKNGNKTNPSFYFELPASLVPGINNISLLSIIVGLPDSGAHLEKRTLGISKVTLKGLDQEDLELSEEKWTYQIGLEGELLSLFSDNDSNKVDWTSSLSQNRPLTWYKTTLTAPEGNEAVAIDLSSMGKGQVWINGNSIGRYWVSYLAPSQDCSGCNYRGSYSLHKCATNCGKPAQTMYHIPRAWLQPTGNLLVISEEIGGDPTKISLITGPHTDNLCSYTSQILTDEYSQPTLQLHCHGGKAISSVQFASPNNYQDLCGSFVQGSCHSTTSQKAVEKVCLGQQKCSVALASSGLGENPCMGTLQSFAVHATCT